VKAFLGGHPTPTGLRNTLDSVSMLNIEDRQGQWRCQ
jgi:hypothetical protein